MAEQPEGVTPQAPPPSFDSVVNQSAQQPVVFAPPKDDADHATRTAGWTEKLKDPAIQLALLTFGARLAGPGVPGSTAMGHLTGAMLGGAHAYAAYNAEQDTRAMEHQKVQNQTDATGAEVTLKGAQTGQVGAQTDAITAEVDRKKQMLPFELQKLEADVNNAKSLDEYRRALKRASEVETNIKETYGGREAESQIALRSAQAIAAKAQAGYAEAHARHADALVKAMTDEAGGWVVSAKTDPNTGLTHITRYNKKSGDGELITEKPALEPVEAQAKAKLEVSTALKNARGMFGSGPTEEDILKKFGGATNAKDAIAFVAGQYQQPRREVTPLKNGMPGGASKNVSEAEFNMSAGVAPQSPQDVQMYYAKLHELTARAQKEGLTPEIDKGIRSIAKGLDAAGLPVKTGPMPIAAPISSGIPPEIQAEVKRSPMPKELEGKTSVYKADDGSQWRVDGKGNVLGRYQPPAAPANSAPQTPVQAPQTAPQPSGGATPSPQPANANAPSTGADAVAEFLGQKRSERERELLQKQQMYKSAKAAIQAQMQQAAQNKDQALLMQLSQQFSALTAQEQALTQQ